MLDMISNFLTTVDDFVWGIPLIVLILATGLFLTARSRAKTAKYPVSRHCVRHCPLPSEPVISLVWQRLL